MYHESPRKDRSTKMCLCVRACEHVYLYQLLKAEMKRGSGKKEKGYERPACGRLVPLKNCSAYTTAILNRDYK